MYHRAPQSWTVTEAASTNSDDYVFGFLAGAGGEQPSVSLPTGGPYSSNDNFTSSENGLDASLQ